MKRFRFFIYLFLSFFSIVMPMHSIKYNVLFNHLPKHTNFSLLLMGYTANTNIPYCFAIDNSECISYPYQVHPTGESFFCSSIYPHYLDCINQYRIQIQNKSPLAQFYTIKNIDNYLFASCSGDLQNLYFINPQTMHVQLLRYPKHLNIGKQYPSYIHSVKDKWIMLGGEINAYHAIIYIIDPNKLVVQDAIRVSTHPSCLSYHHYGMCNNGNCIFINGNSLLVYYPFTHESKVVPTPFDAEQIVIDHCSTLALSTMNDKLSYVLFTKDWNIQSKGSLSLITKDCLLLQSFLQGSMLYLVQYTPTHPQYTYWITIYDLSTEHMVYCAGINSNRSFYFIDAKYDFSPHEQSDCSKTSLAVK